MHTEHVFFPKIPAELGSRLVFRRLRVGHRRGVGRPGRFVPMLVRDQGKGRNFSVVRGDVRLG